MNLKVCLLVGVASIVIGQTLGAPCWGCDGKGGKDVCNCGQTVVKPPMPKKLHKINKSIHSRLKLYGQSCGCSKSELALPFLHEKNVYVEQPPVTPLYPAYPQSPREYAPHHTHYEQLPTPVHQVYQRPAMMQLPYTHHPQLDRSYRSNPAPQPYAQTQPEQGRTSRSNLEPQQYAPAQPYAQTQPEQGRTFRSNLEPQQYATDQPEQERTYRSNLEPQQYAQTQPDQERTYRSNLEPQQYAPYLPEQEKMHRSNLEPQQYAQSLPEQERTHRSNLDPQQYAPTQSEQERTYRSNLDPQQYGPADSVGQPNNDNHPINKRSENAQLIANTAKPNTRRISKRSYSTNQADYGNGYQSPKADAVSIALALQVAKKLEKLIQEEQLHGYDTIPEDATYGKYEKDVAEGGLQNYDSDVLELSNDLLSYIDAQKYANEDGVRKEAHFPERFPLLLDIGYRPIKEQAPLDNYEDDQDESSTVVGLNNDDHPGSYDDGYKPVYQPYEHDREEPYAEPY